MNIAGREIKNGTVPYIISEISGNHCGTFHLASQLIETAKKAGADAVKTQCYEADTITLDCKKMDFIVQGGLWRGRTLHELYRKACTPFSWHKDLYKLAKDVNITIFSSVFDRSSVDLLESLGCPAYKIASFEVGDTPLIRYAASTGKPLIISTGMANEHEIRDAKEAASGNVAFLHCTSEYPGTIETSDINRMNRLRLLVGGLPTGLSDHTKGHLVPIAATALGACIIEKHLKLDPKDAPPSEDDSFSLTPTEFASMVSAVQQTAAAMKEQPLNGSPSRQFRRSLYAVADIAEGEEFTEKNIRSIRPGYGMAPNRYPALLGKKARRGFKRGDPLS